MTTVTGKIESATGATLHATITFTSLSTPQFPPTIVQVNTVKRIKSNASTGEFSQVLAAGNYGVVVSASKIETRFNIAVPDGSSTISIEDLVTSSVSTLPGDAPYTVWNGQRAGHFTFIPVDNPGVPTLAPVTVSGGHQGAFDLFAYVVAWETTEGMTLACADVINTPPTSPNNGTRVTLPSPPSRVTAVHIYRSTNDSTTNRYLLASVAPSVLYYDDWEDTADFNARLNPALVPAQFNTTAGVIFSSPGVAQLYFSSTGLRVLSALQLDGLIKIPTDAAAGHVLTSDADGYATWAAPTGGGGSGSSALLNGDDGQVYEIVGVTVGGVMTLKLVPLFTGTITGAIITADDGHTYQLSGQTVDGVMTIQLTQQ